MHVAVISAVEALWVTQVSRFIVQSILHSTNHPVLHLLAVVSTNRCGGNHTIHGLSPLEAMIRIGCQV